MFIELQRYYDDRDGSDELTTPEKLSHVPPIHERDATISLNVNHCVAVEDIYVIDDDKDSSNYMVMVKSGVSEVTTSGGRIILCYGTASEITGSICDEMLAWAEPNHPV